MGSDDVLLCIGFSLRARSLDTAALASGVWASSSSDISAPGSTLPKASNSMAGTWATACRGEAAAAVVEALEVVLLSEMPNGSNCGIRSCKATNE